MVPGVASTASAMGVGRPGAPNVPQVTASGVPGGLGQFGGTAPYGGTSFEQLNPAGIPAGTRTSEELETDTNVRDLNKLASAARAWTEDAKQREMQRQMAAAGIRSNIATRAAMLRQAQLGAQQMGQTSLAGVINTLGAQYQYS